MRNYSPSRPRHSGRATALPGDFLPNVHVFGRETPQEVWRRLVAGRYACDFCGDPVGCLVRVYLPISLLVQHFPDRHFRPVSIFDQTRTHNEPYAAVSIHPFCRDHVKIGQEQIAQTYPDCAYVEIDTGPREQVTSQVPANFEIN